MTVINMALFFVRFVKTTMSAFFILHQFLGTVQTAQTPGGIDGGNSRSKSGEDTGTIYELGFGYFTVKRTANSFQIDSPCYRESRGAL